MEAIAEGVSATGVVSTLSQMSGKKIGGEER